jgi:predicted Fe-Mo cluster-binding NifX family protein
MKIAISSHDGKLNGQYSPRFGRCESFIFIDTETGDWEAQPNPAASARGGAGAQVVQFLSDMGVEATIAGRFGPNAFSALNAAGIKAYTADGGTPKELLNRFLEDKLLRVNSASGLGHRHQA